MAQGIKEKIKGFVESDGTSNPGVSTLGLAVDTGKESNTPEAFYPTSRPWAPQDAADNTSKPSSHEKEAAGTTPPSAKTPTDESAYRGTDVGYDEQQRESEKKADGNPLGKDFSPPGGEAGKYLGEGQTPTDAERTAGNPLGTDDKGTDFASTGGEADKYLGA